jgi:FAD-dependent sensor of blue light
VLRQLAFASRARLGLRASETSDLIATSRANNARDDVTGVLLYTGDSFLAIVEGRDAAIAALWRRLVIDDRHRSIVSLFDLAERDRSFQGWRAGYLPEQQLAPLLIRWRALAPSLPADEIAQLRALCESTPTF